MKIVKKVFIFILIMFVFSINKAFAVTGIVNTDAVRLREKPSTDSNIITNIYQNEEMEILETEGDWIKVKYGENTGYVKKEYIKEKQNTANTNEANTTNKNEIDENTANENTISENKTNENSVNENTVNENLENNNSENQNNLVYVISSETYARFLPNIASNRFLKLEKDKEVTKILEMNNWVKINVDNSEGWIPSIKLTAKSVENEAKANQEETNTNTNQNNTQKEQEPETPERESDVGKTGKINVETAIVREKADKSSEEINSLDYDDVVNIIGEDGDWYQITSGDVKGYVNKRLITINVSSRGSTTERMDVDNTTVAEDKNNILNQALSNVDNESKGEEIAEYAKQYLGLPYVSGGKNPSTGFDCSGFTQYVYKNFGYSLESTASGQNSLGTDITMENLEPGDLILFYNEEKTKIGHTGIYLGDGNFVHSANSNRGVVTDNLNTSTYYNTRFVNAKRLTD